MVERIELYALQRDRRVQEERGDGMSVIGALLGLLLVVIVMTVCWFLANLVVPQSEIDKIDAIGRWAKEELERREVT